MTISKNTYGAIGARVYTPEGPFTSLVNNQGVQPSPSFAPGEQVDVDAEGRIIALYFIPTTAVTLNQGDVLWWDQTYIAQLTGTGSASAPFGAGVGVFYMGARVGDPAAAPNPGNQWSYTFQPGIYLIWAQKYGTQVANIATGGTQTKPVNSTATLGQVAQPASPLAGSMGITGIYACASSITFTGNTTSGSAVITNVSSSKQLGRGQIVTGTNVPANTYIQDISGATVTLSNAATGTATGTTFTSSIYVTYGNVTSGSNQITGVPHLNGILPNQTLTGTGIPGSTTITSITGGPGSFTITISANATATNAGVALTATGYPEAFLRNPMVASQN